MKWCVCAIPQPCHELHCWLCAIPQTRHGLTLLVVGLRVLRAFPVKELVTEDDTINAEMDPEDVFKVTEHIQDQHDLR